MKEELANEAPMQPTVLDAPRRRRHGQLIPWPPRCGQPAGALAQHATTTSAPTPPEVRP